MGLYDQVKNADTPYISQYVGSIVPELDDYAKTMQTKYNQAADTDDSLTEAMNNLQHLGFASDTQYANELKQKYYQRLQDRASTGDYENMGRRTRRDAMNFSAEYQPLIQRQNDFATIARRINGDPNIVDADKKQQILNYVKDMNATPVDPTTGDYQRDASGKIMLNGIQDWNYAKDVDINKKLTDLLSKKEADIKQTGYTSDGQGLKISSVDKLRDPAVMAGLANQMMQSDPEIKAMLNRDVTLQNYKLQPDQVQAQLQPLNVSVATQLKQRGLNNKQITEYAKSNGMSVDDLNTPVLKRQQSQYMANGMSADAANRAILDNQTYQGMMRPHADLVGNLLGYDQKTVDAKDDVLFNEQQKAKMAAAQNIKDPNFEYTTSTIANVNKANPLDDVHSYGDVSKTLSASGSALNATILGAMKLAGVATGDPKKDTATAVAIMHNKQQLYALRDQIKNTNPEIAAGLQGRSDQYDDAADAVQVQGNRVGDIENAAGVNIDKLYQQYRTGKIPGISIDHKDSELLNKNDFENAMRSSGTNYGISGYIPDWLGGNSKQGLMKARSYYQDAIQNSTNKQHIDENFHTLEATGDGKVADNSKLIAQMANTGNLRVTDLHDPSAGSQSVYKLMGIDPGKYDKATQLEEKGLSIKFNAESVNGHPTLTIFNKQDGTSRVVRADNLPSNIQDEMAIEGIKKGMVSSSSDYAKDVMKQSLISLGSNSMTNITPQYLKALEPSSVVHAINDQYAVQVKPKGDGTNKYVMYVKDANGNYKPTQTTFDSVDDLAVDIGNMRYGGIRPANGRP